MTRTSHDSVASVDGFAISPVQRAILRAAADPSALPADVIAHLDLPAVPEAALLAALERVARCHDVLRSDYHQLSGMSEPAQVPRVDPIVRPGEPGSLTVNTAFSWSPVIEEREAGVRLTLALPSFLADPASLGRLADELLAGLGLAADLPDEEFPQYADVAQFLSDAGDDAEQELFWRNEITRFADSSAPAVGYERGAQARRFILDQSTNAAVHAAAARHGWAARDIVLAAYLLVLRAVTGRSVSMAVAWSAREAYPELAGVVGPLTFDVPLSVDVPDGTDFAGLMARLRDERDRIDEHALALPALATRLTVPAARFHADFTLAAPGPLRFDHRDATGHDIAMAWTDLAAGECVLAARGDRYSDLDIELLFDRLQAVLGRVCADPTTDVTRLSVLSDAEYHRTVVEFNATDRSYDETPVVARFLDRATATPDAVAVRTATTTVTYGELHDRAQRVADWLRAQGVGTGDYVPLYLDRSPWAIVAMVGVALTGAAYVPLNTAVPPAKLDAVVARLSPRAIMLTTAMTGRLSTPDEIAALVLDTAGLPAPSATTTLPAGTDPAYVIFTSGSTGEPKGVVVAHRRLANLVDWINRTQQVTVGDCVLLVTAFSFDLSVYDVWGTLTAGGTIRLADEAELADPHRLADILRTEPVTIWDSAPAALQQLVPLLTAVKESALRLVLLSGDWIPVTLPGVLAERFDRPVVLAMGGATEATIWSNYHVVAEVPAEWPSIPYGRPMQNCRYYVLDGTGSPVATGVPGELHIGGVCAADGYFGDDQGTAERFLPDPFVPSAVDRLYRTGDLVRHLGGGELEFLGREDDQVKIRGHRVELGEVAVALRSHPDVTEVIVRSVREADANSALVAYWLPAADTDVEHTALIAHLGGMLAPYAIPSYTVRLASIPVTSNGKVDYAALPDHRAPTTAGEAPATDTERSLLAVWAELLGRTDLGVTESFFAAGGHSLVAVRMLTHIQSRFGCRVRMPDFVANATVRDLAVLIDSSQAPVRARPTLARQRPVGDPLSAGQRRMWFLDRLRGPSPTYNIQQAVNLRGPLDAAALATALTDVVSRHEVLRSTYAEVDGEPVQHVVGAGELGPLLHRVQSAPDTIDAQVFDAARYCFDLHADLPIRAWLFAVDTDHHVLLILTHHIASDGTSEAVILRDLAAAYAARSAGRAPGWAAPEVRYRDYVAWQQDLLGSPTDPSSVVSQELDYWSSTLRGAPEALRLPYDRPHPATPSHQGDRVAFTLDTDTLDALHALAKRNDASLFMVLQAATSALLHRFGAGDDITLGTGVAGRTDDALSDLVGFFINTLVLRTDVAGDPTFTDLVARCRSTALGAFGHQDVPFDLVVDHIAPARAAARSPLFQVMLMLRSDVVTDLPIAGLTATVEPINAHVAKFDLLITASENAGTLDVIFEYATDVFDHGTVQRLADGLTAVVDAAITEPGVRLADLDLVDAGQRALLDSWNATDHPVPDATLAELFAAQVARTPEAVAVEFEDNALTYAEFADRVHRLARVLIAQGAGPERVVALALPRSVDLVTAIMATVHAGAAYLPIDQDLPAERVAYMLVDAVPAVIVTTLGAAPLPPTGAPTLVLDHSPADAPGIEFPQVSPDHPAYMMYTSGSTGRPKGVVVPQRGLVNWLSWMQSRYGLAPDDRVLLKTPATFDVSVREFFWPLLNGATLVVARPEGHKDPAYLAETIQRRRITTVHFVPSMLAVFLQEADTADCTTLRRVICSGEALSTELAQQFRAVSRAELHNLYGPTEASVEVSHCAYTSDMASAGVPIGRPTWNTRLHVLDDRLRSVPVGVPGELYLAGPQLARGYLNRPAMTAERFVADPFDAPGSRMYRTGDLVRWNAQGQVDFLGRVDDQVKIRGFRVELGEIETALLRHDTVAHAAVTVQESGGEKRLIGYAVPVAGAVIDSAALREHVGRELPRYMVPIVVTGLAEMPLTVSGKVDRKALPAPDLPTEGAGRAPRTAIEEQLCEIAAGVLGLGRVGVDDNFFDLGGNSLTAMRLASRARTALGLAIEVRTVFEAPTVEQLAAGLGSTPAAPRKPALVPRSR
jgi:amino acid adenylation domain-containing protein